MFERYTERARRVVFFARYEASQYGSPEIDTEHLLLGVLREEKSLRRWLPKADPETIRQRVNNRSPKLASTPTSIDLPLSESAKRVLKFACDEADRLSSKHIATEHLLLGLLDEEHCFAAELLREAGADPAAIRTFYSERSMPSQPLTFQRGSFRDFGFRVLSAETIEIHGSRWNVDYVRDVISLCRAYNWHWHKAVWKPRDVVIHRTQGTCSFELALANDDPANFEVVKDGWKKDHCFVCRWELFLSEDEHGSGYTNGHDWLCPECYERFWQHPEFFSSSFSDIT
jgi:hypothetical protein